jgi:hypothetical protein
MPWCPQCSTEYEAGQTTCADCGAALAARPPDPHAENVVVFEARSVTEAQIAEATLQAEGIEAFVQTIASASPNVGVMGDDVPELEVRVAAEDAGRAREILAEPPVTEEELAAMEEIGPRDGTGDAVV